MVEFSGWKAKSVIEITASCGDVAVLKLKFPRDEVCGRAQLGVAFGFKCGDRVRIDFALADDLGHEIAFVCEAVHCGKHGKGFCVFGGRTRGNWRRAASIYVIDQRFRDGIGVVANVVLEVVAVFADVVGWNAAAVLEMDGVSPCPEAGQSRTQGDGDR